MSGQQGERPVVAAGVIRNGVMTHSETRHTLSLDDYDGRPAVLIVLPHTLDVVSIETLVQAADALDQVIEGAES